eukprot:1142543-Pelagomonas_calceolata.AAC.8
MLACTPRQAQPLAPALSLDSLGHSLQVVWSSMVDWKGLSAPNRYAASYPVCGLWCSCCNAARLPRCTFVPHINFVPSVIPYALASSLNFRVLFWNFTDS